MEIKEFIPLAPLTTFKVGGAARYFCDIHSLADLTEAVAFAREKNLPIFILGGGSNILISDLGFPGVVLHMMIDDSEWENSGDSVSVTLGAGVVWDKFVEESAERNCWGVENLSAVPGTVGASVIQNIGCYGAEVSEVVEWVEVYDSKKNTLRTLARADCLFGYRDSIWKHKSGEGLIVTRVKFRLSRKGTPKITYKELREFFAATRKEPETPSDVRAALLWIRGEKFPDLAHYGTAGSFFKHPIVSRADGEAFLQKFPGAPHYDEGENKMKLVAGWIIDHALGLRGLRKSAVGTWEKQALVLVNYGGASAKEIWIFAEELAQQAKKETNISLLPEVVRVGEF